MIFACELAKRLLDFGVTGGAGNTENLVVIFVLNGHAAMNLPAGGKLSKPQTGKNRGRLLFRALGIVHAQVTRAGEIPGTAPDLDQNAVAFRGFAELDGVFRAGDRMPVDLDNDVVGLKTGIG